MLKPLSTAAEVIEALGLSEVARLTGRLDKEGDPDPEVPRNWPKRGRLPPDTFLVITTALEQRGFSAPPTLWGIAEPNKSEAAA